MFSLSHIVLIHFLASILRQHTVLFSLFILFILCYMELSQPPNLVEIVSGKVRSFCFYCSHAKSRIRNQDQRALVYCIYVTRGCYILAFQHFIPDSHSIFFLHSSMAHWRPVVFSRESAVAKPHPCFSLCIQAPLRYSFARQTM